MEDQDEISGHLILLNRAKRRYDQTQKPQDEQVYRACFDWFRTRRIGIHLRGQSFVLTADKEEPR